MNRITVFCSALNNAYMAVSEDGSVMLTWPEKESEGAFPVSKKFIDAFDNAFGKDSYTLQNIKDPGGSPEFIDAIKRYEDNNKEQEPTGEKSIEEITLDLPVDMTEDKELDLRRRIGILLDQIDTLEYERDCTNKQFKGEIATIEKDVKSIREQLKEKPIGRVICTAHKIDGKVVSVFRNDTGDEVEGVAQTRLPLEDDTPTEMDSTSINEQDTPDAQQENINGPQGVEENESGNN